MKVLDIVIDQATCTNDKASCEIAVLARLQGVLDRYQVHDGLVTSIETEIDMEGIIVTLHTPNKETRDIVAGILNEALAHVPQRWFPPSTESAAGQWQDDSSSLIAHIRLQVDIEIT